MFNRELEWRYFSKFVSEHIIDYTIKQYGDSPHDEVQNWTPEQCVKSIGKYVRRFESGQRGASETLRDMFKIAHFACLAYFKLCLCYGVAPKHNTFTNDNPFVHGKDRDNAKQPD